MAVAPRAVHSVVADLPEGQEGGDQVQAATAGGTTPGGNA